MGNGGRPRWTGFSPKSFPCLFAPSIESALVVVYTTRAQPGRNVSQQLEELKNLVTVLALNLHAQGDVKKIDHLAPVFNLFGPGMIPPWLEEKLPDAIRKIIEKTNNSMISGTE